MGIFSLRIQSAECKQQTGVGVWLTRRMIPSRAEKCMEELAATVLLEESALCSEKNANFRAGNNWI
jgi:hypothetical protein